MTSREKKRFFSGIVQIVRSGQSGLWLLFADTECVIVYEQRIYMEAKIDVNSSWYMVEFKNQFVRLCVDNNCNESVVVGDRNCKESVGGRDLMLLHRSRPIREGSPHRSHSVLCNFS